MSNAKKTLRWQSNQRCSIIHNTWLPFWVLGMFGSKMSLDCHWVFVQGNLWRLTNHDHPYVGLQSENPSVILLSQGQGCLDLASLDPMGYHATSNMPANVNIKIYNILEHMKIHTSRHSHTSHTGSSWINILYRSLISIVSFESIEFDVCIYLHPSTGTVYMQ